MNAQEIIEKFLDLEYEKLKNNVVFTELTELPSEDNNDELNGYKTIYVLFKFADDYKEEDNYRFLGKPDEFGFALMHDVVYVNRNDEVFLVARGRLGGVTQEADYIYPDDTREKIIEKYKKGTGALISLFKQSFPFDDTWDGEYAFNEKLLKNLAPFYEDDTSKMLQVVEECISIPYESKEKVISSIQRATGSIHLFMGEGLSDEISNGSDTTIEDIYIRELEDELF